MCTDQSKRYFFVFPKVPRTLTKEAGVYQIELFLENTELGLITTYFDMAEAEDKYTKLSTELNVYLKSRGIKIPRVSQDDTEFCDWLIKNLSYKVYSETLKKYIDNDIVVLEEPKISVTGPLTLKPLTTEEREKVTERIRLYNLTTEEREKVTEQIRLYNLMTPEERVENSFLLKEQKNEGLNE